MEGSCRGCCKEHYLALKKKMPKLLETPVMQRFIKVEENKKILDEAMREYDEEKLKLLDESFKEFYHLDRVIAYMIGVIKRYSIDYDKRVNLRNERFPLVLDQAPTSLQNEGGVTIKDLIESNKYLPEEIYERKQNEKEIGFAILDSHPLKPILSKLNSRQREIISLYYLKGYNNKEIGELFNQTEQNISYWHKKTKKQMKEIQYN